MNEKKIDPRDLKPSDKEDPEKADRVGSEKSQLDKPGPQPGTEPPGKQPPPPGQDSSPLLQENQRKPEDLK